MMTSKESSLPLFARLVLVDAMAIERALDRIRTQQLVPRVPNSWQIFLGVARMWHRVLTRPESVGKGGGRPARKTWRAQLLQVHALRFPFLVRERAIAPLDFSGLLSSRERIIRHLLAAHHDREEFVYDFELLRAHPGAREELLSRARELVAEDSPRQAWLRDLCVYEGYHERLIDALERELAAESDRTDDVSTPPRDPDDSFVAYLEWCARQPETWRETVHALFQKGVAQA